MIFSLSRGLWACIWACIVSCSTYVCAAESLHTVHLVNKCGFGDLSLVPLQQQVLGNGSTGFTNTTVQAVAFLMQDSCGPNGENCTALDINLGATSPDYSSVNFLPNGFSVPTSFIFYGGCAGGAQCLNPSCANQTVSCMVPNTNVFVTFCPTLPSTSLLVSTSSVQASSSSPTPSLPTPLSPLTSPQSTILPSTGSAQAGVKRAQVRAIVGGVLGSFAVLVILLVIFFLWRRKRTGTNAPLAPPFIWTIPRSPTSANYSNSFGGRVGLMAETRGTRRPIGSFWED